MIKPLSPLLALALPAVLPAADPEALSHFSDPAEAETFAWFAGEKKQGDVYVRKNADGEVEWIGVTGEGEPSKFFYNGSVTLDDEGRVVAMRSNGADLSDEDLRRLASFERLQELVLWHNGSSKEPENYTGAGLRAFAGRPIERILFGGCSFGDPGVATFQDLPELRVADIYHCRVTDAGLATLEGHPSLEEIHVGPSYEKRITDAGLASLSAIPNLKRLKVNETYLSWEGLKQLEARKQTLEELDLGVSLISPEDLERLRELLPDTVIKHEGVEGVRKFVGGRKYMENRIRSWMPPEVVAVYLGDAAE